MRSYSIVSIATLGASSCVLFFTPKSSEGAKNSGGPWKRLILIYSSILYGTFSLVDRVIVRRSYNCRQIGYNTLETPFCPQQE